MKHFPPDTDPWQRSRGSSATSEHGKSGWGRSSASGFCHAWRFQSDPAAPGNPRTPVQNHRKIINKTGGKLKHCHIKMEGLLRHVCDHIKNQVFWPKNILYTKYTEITENTLLWILVMTRQCKYIKKILIADKKISEWNNTDDSQTIGILTPYELRRS